MIGRITYDLIMEDDMSFIEGCYRLPFKEWEVFTITKYDDIGIIEVEHTSWDNGVTGVHIRIPRGIRINAERTEMIMSKVFGVERWVVVRGSDSMQLRYVRGFGGRRE